MTSLAQAHREWPRMRCHSCDEWIRDPDADIVCPNCDSDQYDFALNVPVYSSIHFEPEYRMTLMERYKARPSGEGFDRMCRIDYWSRRGEVARRYPSRPPTRPVFFRRPDTDQSDA